MEKTESWAHDNQAVNAFTDAQHALPHIHEKTSAIKSTIKSTLWGLISAAARLGFFFFFSPASIKYKTRHLHALHVSY